MRVTYFFLFFLVVTPLCGQVKDTLSSSSAVDSLSYESRSNSSDSAFTLPSFLDEKFNLLSQEKFKTRQGRLNDNLFMMKYLQAGWYTLGAVGYSLTSLKQDLSKPVFFPLGFNVNSAVGYSSNDGSYSIELGSYIDVVGMEGTDFGRFDWTQVTPNNARLLDPEGLRSLDVVTWSTIFYLGIRARFPNVVPTNTFNPYLKVFFGRGVGVLFLDTDEDDRFEAVIDGKRFHIEGVHFGLSISNFYNVFNSSPAWFWEITFTNQLSNEYYFVAESGARPTEIANEAIPNQTAFFVLRFSVGTRFF